MTRNPLAILLLLAGCGDVVDRAECRTGSQCPAGESCAHTPEGSVCWPDPIAPTGTILDVACGAPDCLRDGTLAVSAEAADDRELLGVWASTDLDPGRWVPLARGAGAAWSGTLPLDALPFPALEREVIVTLRVVDGARNAFEVAAGDGLRPRVTRVRWSRSLDTSVVTPTAPAVVADGTVVVGGSDGKLRLFGADGAAAHPTLALAGSAIAQPPSLGSQAIWVAANDGKLYAVKPDGSAELASRTCSASGVAKGPPAVLTEGGVDVAFGAFSNGRIAASTPSACAMAPQRDGYSSGAAISATGRVIGSTASAGVAAVRAFSWDGGAFEELWTASTGGAVAVAPIFDGEDRIVTGSTDAGLDLTTLAGATSPLATVDGSIDDSPIVLAGGDVVVGDASGKLHRIRPDGTAAWDPPVALASGAGVHAPMALVDGGALVLVAATRDGSVHAVAGDGTLLWSGNLTGGPELSAGNLHTPPGSRFSTAYFGGADGRLHAVIVDGALDGSAPWPKAWRDAGNTSRARTGGN